MFNGRTLLVATMHEKEKVIAPIFEKELGLKCITPFNFNSDALGTFTGEIERKDDALNTARKKCFIAMELNNCDMAISSEGSFGPHPVMYIHPADDEILLFIDKKNDLEIVVRELSAQTNYNAREIKSEKELKEFADAAKFPSHGLIIRKDKENYNNIKKGIRDWETLLKNYNHISKKDGIAFVETDMRAMHNPTRMKVIENTTIKLVHKIKSKCPSCHTPGFGITATKKGLPCGLCRFPTSSVLAYIYTCLKCNYQNVKNNPNSKQCEDPMFCDRCNP
ncbi:DUF6671 family protein [Candidatus Brachybacter algidus]|uniref:DUF6671 family protein n=1 Tax=Candidatus Brachybacter algidus TaxID=2982024 RepID=UPI001D53D336|nr:DUF6671 family protein [Candidatus Brachybacter algidus]MBK6447917.1 hypothetical protein [Candidatus Brachybacter algidus]MBK9397369.1 hypothetical protein [Candidatus Brachybacter algidus]